jgi:tRNA(His) 5'-end guanylyltransferase
MDQLEAEFRGIEDRSLNMPAAPLGSYLCFRMDGIKVSKRFLKDSLSNPAFQAALHGAVEAVYYIFRHCTGLEYTRYEEGNFFLCAIAVSDEVSFVLNNRLNHMQNRLFKTGTALASSLSAAVTLRFAQHSAKKGKVTASGKQWPQGIAFDGRPLVLEGLGQVEDYLKLRWLLWTRNAMCKVLRLNNIMDRERLYHGDLKDNVPVLAKLVEGHGLRAQCAELMSEFTLFLPDQPSHAAGLLALTTPPGFGDDALAEHLSRLRDLARRLQDIPPGTPVRTP